jgi:hypothetical protein
MSPFNPLCCRNILSLKVKPTAKIIALSTTYKATLDLQYLYLPGIANFLFTKSIYFQTMEDAKDAKMEIERIRNLPGKYCHCEKGGGGCAMPIEQMS